MPSLLPVDKIMRSKNSSTAKFEAWKEQVLLEAEIKAEEYERKEAALRADEIDNDHDSHDVVHLSNSAHSVRVMAREEIQKATDRRNGVSSKPCGDRNVTRCDMRGRLLPSFREPAASSFSTSLPTSRNNAAASSDIIVIDLSNNSPTYASAVVGGDLISDKVYTSAVRARMSKRLDHKHVESNPETHSQ